MLEAIRLAEEITGREFNWDYSESNRVGDHIWWISDISRFMSHYPEWQLQYSLLDIMQAVIDGQAERLET